MFETLDTINTLLSTHFDKHGSGLTYLCSTQNWTHVPFELEPAPSPLRIYQQLELIAQTVSRAMRSDQIFKLLSQLYGPIFDYVQSFSELHTDREYLLKILHHGILNAFTEEGTTYRDKLLQENTITFVGGMGLPKNSRSVPATKALLNFIENLISMRMKLKMDYALYHTYLNEFFGVGMFTGEKDENTKNQSTQNSPDLFITFGTVCALLECLDVVFDERLPASGTVTNYASLAQVIDAGEEMLRPGGQKYCGRPGMRFIALFPAFVKKKAGSAPGLQSNADLFYTERPKTVVQSYQVKNQNLFMQPLTPVYLARLAIFDPGLADYDWSHKLRPGQQTSSALSQNLSDNLLSQISISSGDRRSSGIEELHGAAKISVNDAMRTTFYHQCQQTKKDKENQTLYLIDEVEQLMRQGKSIWAKLQGRQQMMNMKAKTQENEENNEKIDETAVQETLKPPQNDIQIEDQSKYNTYEQDIKSSYQVYLEQREPESKIKWTQKQLNTKYSEIVEAH